MATRQQQLDFVQKYGPQAQAVAQKTGIPASVMLAIAANETGWGTVGIGVTHNAWFGEKTSASAPGGDAGTISVPAAWEVIGGRNVFVPATFNAYSSFQSSAEGFVRFLQNNSRYHDTLSNFAATRDRNALVQGLQAAHYATDPTWGGRMIQMADQIDGFLGSPQPGGTSPVTSSPTNSSDLAPLIRSIGGIQLNPPTQTQTPGQIQLPGQIQITNPIEAVANAIGGGFGQLGTSIHDAIATFVLSLLHVILGIFFLVMILLGLYLLLAN
jgi:Mannosyl-glycoprotein endo-beta-N-acetylglucosaminidase